MESNMELQRRGGRATEQIDPDQLAELYLHVVQQFTNLKYSPSSEVSQSPTLLVRLNLLFVKLTRLGVVLGMDKLNDPIDTRTLPPGHPLIQARLGDSNLIGLSKDLRNLTTLFSSPSKSKERSSARSNWRPFWEFGKDASVDANRFCIALKDIALKRDLGQVDDDYTTALEGSRIKKFAITLDKLFSQIPQLSLKLQELAVREAEEILASGLPPTELTDLLNEAECDKLLQDALNMQIAGASAMDSKSNVTNQHIHVQGGYLGIFNATSNHQVNNGGQRAVCVGSFHGNDITGCTLYFGVLPDEVASQAH